MMTGFADANVVSTSSHISGLFGGASFTGSAAKSGLPNARSGPKFAMLAYMDFLLLLGEETTSMTALGEIEWQLTNSAITFMKHRVIPGSESMVLPLPVSVSVGDRGWATEFL